MITFAHGLLSGIAHPVVGYDHLFFIIATGVLCAFAGVRWSGPVLLLIGVVSGVLLALSGLVVQKGELLVALSLVLVCVPGMLAKRIGADWLSGLLLLLGALHGLMYGQVLAQEQVIVPQVMAGYLAGLVSVHYLVAVAAAIWLFKGAPSRSGRAISQSILKPQLSCALGTVVGLTLILNQLV